MNLTAIAKYLDESAEERERKRKEEEAEKLILRYLDSPQQAGASAYQRATSTINREGIMDGGDTQKPAGTPYRGGPLPPLEEIQIKYGGTEPVQRYMAIEEAKRKAEQEAQQQELYRKGVSQYADLFEDTDPEFANFVRMGVNTGILSDKKDIIEAFGKYLESQRRKKESALEREASQKRAEIMAGAGITKAKIGAEGKEDRTMFEKENKLRSQYNSLSQHFSIIRDSYSRVVTSAKNPSAAGDLSMIFNYMRMLDPKSVVRESEYASAENARGVPEHIRNLYNKIIDGMILTPKQREDFLERAKELYQSSERIQKQLKDQYESIAMSYGINPERVTGSVVIGIGERSMNPIDELRKRAAAGDTDAQKYLTSKGMSW